MTTAIQTDQLTDALQGLEQQLEIPYVPGELDTWTMGVQKLLVKANDALRTMMRKDHPASFDMILKNDLELARRVDQMRAEDEQLLTQFDAVTL